ncbi:MAG: penicillin acylase family protein [Solirubrobacterales bacterium]|nr:penicillin acylase family protein [Solirubrobacterales bacterium]
MRRALLAVCVGIAGLGALIWAQTAAARKARRGVPTVVIRRTSYGIPHITARNLKGAGEGYGYAFAQDNVCTMAEDYITVDAQRSRFFGPSGSYEQRGNGVTVNNLDSDFFFQQLIDSHTIEHLLARRPPFGPERGVRQLVAGYVKGYNRYLRRVGGARGVRDPRCRGRSWVRPIRQIEVYRRFYQLIEMASGDVVIPGIAQAKPPVGLGGLGGGLPSPQQTAAMINQRLPRGGLGALGSNAVAVGSAGTRDHKHGLLLGNPHFPWIGSERFYQAQIHVPGKIDVEGASLFGVPLVLIGHTATMAWSHTVSTAFRFTPFQLTLIPGSPTSYLFDGRVQRMTSRTVTVGARGGDGRLHQMSRTLYSSRFGPIFTSIEGVPLPWTGASAFALGDANPDNFRVFNHFFDVDRARSAPQVLRILERYEGIPWVNTLVADKQGRALYADIGAVPNVSNAEAARCNTAVGTGTYRVIGLPVLDGSRSSCSWANDRDAIEPGLFGSSHLPHLYRSDYVTNSNDSYWLSNPHQPLTGFARIIGDEATQRSLRTRIGLIMTQSRVDGTDGLGRAGFTARDMQREVFSDRQYAGELTRDALVSMCRSMPGGAAPTSSGGSVPVGNACDVLARWDLHENLGSRGAVLFRRFWDHADVVLASKLEVSSPFSRPFDPRDPVNTPNTLNTSSPGVKSALGDAIEDLNGARVPLDAAPGDVQAVVGNGRRIPIHGGIADPNGDFDAITTAFTPGQGFGPIYHGSSFVQVITWGKGRCPVGGSILTYSESENPASRHHTDQTALFSRKRWVKDRFCNRAVRADTKSVTVLERTRTKKHARGRSRGRRQARFVLVPAAGGDGSNWTL